MSKINQLKQFGLNENEAKAYLALLKLSQSTISNLSSETLISRTTLYYSIQKLKEKGLVFERLKGKKKYFTPRQPTVLEKKAQYQLKNAQFVNDNVQDLIQSLKQIVQEPSSYSKIEHYEGKNSVWEVFEKILKSNQDSYWFGFDENFFNHYNYKYFLNNFTKKRRQFGKTKTYSIIPPIKQAVKAAEKKEIDFHEIKFLTKQTQFNAGICVFGNRIAIFSYDHDLSATILEGEAISGIIKSMFFLIWDDMK